MTRSYNYVVSGESLLSPVFKKLTNALIKTTPRALPANFITLLANLFCWVALYLSINPSLLEPLNGLVISFLLIIYLLGDHLDGLQAKSTGTSSPLGEFIDHFLDALNLGVVVYIVAITFNVGNLWLLSATLLTTYAAQVGNYYHQFKSGELVRHSIGFTEFVAISALLIIMKELTPHWFEYQLIVGFGLAECFLLTATVVGIFNFVQMLIRITHITYGIWLFVGALCIAACLSVLMFSLLQVVITISLYASWYVAKLLTAHLVDGLERSTGLVTPLVLLLAYFWHSLYPTNTFIIVVAYISFNMLILVYRVIKALKTYWLWSNPKA